MRTVAFFIFMIFFGFHTVSGQFSIDVTMNSYYDDNLYRSPSAEKDLFTNFGLALEYELAHSNLTLTYSPDFYLFNENTIRNFSLHGFDADYFRSFQSGKIYVFAGAGTTYRLNKTDYNFYNYNQVSAYLNARFNLSYFFLRLGYNYRYRYYPNFSDISNSIHQFFIQLNRSLPTKTTFILEAGLGNKRFAQYESVTAILQTYDATGGHQGKGRRNEATGMDSMYYLVSENISPPSIAQASLLWRITQSLHPRLGMYVEYRKQMSLTDDTQFTNLNTYLQDEELFDDPFSYESDRIGARLTWLMPWSTKLITGYQYTSKEYISEQAYISETDTLAAGGIRKDRLSSAYLTLVKTFRPDNSWFELIEVPFRFNMIRNRSNSYWYEYDNKLISAGVQFRF